MTGFIPKGARPYWKKRKTEEIKKKTFGERKKIRKEKRRSPKGLIRKVNVKDHVGRDGSTRDDIHRDGGFGGLFLRSPAQCPVAYDQSRLRVSTTAATHRSTWPGTQPAFPWQWYETWAVEGDF